VAEAYEVITSVKETEDEEAEEYHEYKFDFGAGYSGPLGMSLAGQGAPPLTRVQVSQLVPDGKAQSVGI
jgi:hypothetical protein